MNRQVILGLTALGVFCFVIAWPRHGGKDRAGAARTVSRPSLLELLQLPPDTVAKLEGWRTVEDLSEPLAQFETVFWEPADTESLRLLIRSTPLVKGKTVLEIGCGAGLVSLCCLQAGADMVVATDVNPSAIANSAYNAEMLGFRDRFEPRWVSPVRPGAFQVIGESERFDLIISNPPWENRKPATYAEYALYDENFALMRTLLGGLEQHLAPEGKALLVYGVVDAVNTVTQLARQYNLTVRVLDDRDLDELPPEFLPGMLLEVTPASRPIDRQRPGEESSS